MERPILFSAPMVSAILNGKKTVTRRIVKSTQSVTSISAQYPTTTDLGSGGAMTEMESESSTVTHSVAEDVCPFGQPGDQLWLKESFYAFGHWEAELNDSTQRDEWHFVDLTLSTGLTYQFVEPLDYVKTSRSDPRSGWWLRPSLFMPRRASRIDLEITAVHKERLRDITEEQAIAEGFSPLHDGTHGYFVNHMPPPNAGMSVTAVIAFAVFWQSLHGTQSWSENPWVWVIGFRRITS
ncbi:MAG: hypothetical protein JWR17_5056 [Pseudomonas sp.]|jgi:hypothetical protein|uniref:hypothetical protein n=1 Tax=Pseudomonas sp. TaxID=306 RepID=UPI00262B1461|nr:hypothetical protein [Pseudomonas sp.]MDB6052310.1 hypothetical protein [Pseudomonas sp.]